MTSAGLAPEPEADGLATGLRVAGAERRQAERAVVPRIALGSDAHRRLVEEGNDRGEDLLAREAAAAQVPGDCAAKARQPRTERRHALELVRVAAVAEVGVVAVLLPAAGVDARRQQVPSRCGEIHTSRHAGGMASPSIHARVSASTGVPSSAR